jgi:putative FmdB family regulatory protein
MPIYEYQCKNCNYHFEQLQKVDDKPLLKCPQCGQLKLSKLISKTSFQLKGSGWYVTDFKDNKNKEKHNKAEQNKQDNPKKLEKTTETEKPNQNKNSKTENNKGNNND